MPEIAFCVRKAKPQPWGSNEWPWREAVAVAARQAATEHSFRQPSASTRFALALLFRFRRSDIGNADLDNLAKPVMDTIFLSRNVQAPKPGVSGVLFPIDDGRVFRLELEKTEVSSEEDQGVDARVVWE